MGRSWREVQKDELKDQIETTSQPPSDTLYKRTSDNLQENLEAKHVQMLKLNY